MKYSFVRKSVADGFSHFFFLYCSLMFITSKLTLDFSMTKNLLICIFFAVLRIMIYLFFLKKEKDCKIKFWFSFCGTCVSALCILVYFVLLLTFPTFPVNFFVRELNNADGFTILISISIYVCSALILKILFFIIDFIKNNYRINLNH